MATTLKTLVVALSLGVASLASPALADGYLVCEGGAIVSAEAFGDHRTDIAASGCAEVSTFQTGDGTVLEAFVDEYGRLAAYDSDGSVTYYQVDGTSQVGSRSVDAFVRIVAAGDSRVANYTVGGTTDVETSGRGEVVTENHGGTVTYRGSGNAKIYVGPAR